MKRIIFWGLFLIISAAFLRFIYVYAIETESSGMGPQGYGKNIEIQGIIMRNPIRERNKRGIKRYCQDRIKATHVLKVDAKTESEKNISDELALFFFKKDSSNLWGMLSKKRLSQYEGKKVKLYGLLIDNGIYCPSTTKERKNNESFQPCRYLMIRSIKQTGINQHLSPLPKNK